MPKGKGSPVIRARVSQLLLDQIEREIQKHNESPTHVPMTMSDFIVRAVWAYLSKRARSRRSRVEKDIDKLDAAVDRQESE